MAKVGTPKVYDTHKEALALDKWSKTDEATALVQFCNLRDVYPQRIYDWRDESPEFAEVLKKTQCRLAERLRTKMHEGTYNYGLFMSELGCHDKIYHDYKDSLSVREHDLKKLLIKYEHDLKIADTKIVTEELQGQYDAVMAQLTSMQSERKSAKSKGKIDAKSA